LTGANINKTETITAEQYKITENENGNYTVSIIAKGDGVNYSDSDAKTATADYTKLAYDWSKPPFKTFLDIPDVTQDDISDIEYLKNNYDSFVYGMLLSTEAYMNVQGEISGFSVLFTQWLTQLFDISFVVENYYFSDLIDGLEFGGIDFTGDLTATEERKLTYFQTEPIAQRPVVYFRLSDSSPISEIITERKVKIGALFGDIIIESLDMNTSIPMSVSNYDEAYSLLKAGGIDAFIDYSNVETSFDCYDDIIVETLYPLSFCLTSLTTKNPELLPIIDVINKALAQNGTNQYLAYLYTQGYDEYKENKMS